MVFKCLALSLAMYLITIQPAHAYFEPSTFWMALQGAVALVAGGLLALKIYWLNAVRFFREILKKSAPKTDKPDQ